MQIIHIDMDMFYAAVEIRDNPELADKPLIIGAMPGVDLRGVVSTCNYIARKYGVRSAMSMKEAYRRCPHGVFMHPNGHKYVEVSRQIHKIWDDYTDLAEYISLDEGFLDVTGSVQLFGGAEKIGREIKRRVFEETRLTCSVGVGYSMMSAKLASEEKKPDGFFQILTPEALRELIIDRSIRIVYGVGAQTEAQLNKIGVFTVRGIYNNRELIIQRLGNHGRHIVELADGIDNRKISPSSEYKSQSLGKELTFQTNITDREYVRDVLRLIARELSFQTRLDGVFARTITLKITFGDMKKITRSKSGIATNNANAIYNIVSELLEKVECRPIRLAGISLSGFTEEVEEVIETQQLSLFDEPELIEIDKPKKSVELDDVTTDLQRKYGIDIVKSGSEIISEKRVKRGRE